MPITPLHLLVLVYTLFAITRVYGRYKDGTFNIYSFVFWFGLWLAIILATIFVDKTSIIARQLGIGRGVDAFFFLAILLLFYLIYRLYAKFEQMERNITNITRKLALQEQDQNHEV